MALVNLLAKVLACWVGIRENPFVEFKLLQNSSLRDAVRSTLGRHSPTFSCWHTATLTLFTSTVSFGA